jgi:hypothetical protein
MHGLTKLYPAGRGNPASRAAVDAVKAGQDLLESLAFTSSKRRTLASILG